MKKFIWKDKTGRGFSSILTDQDLLEMGDELDWYSNSLHEYAETAEAGETWENAAMQFTCIEEQTVLYNGKEVNSINFGNTDEKK